MHTRRVTEAAPSGNDYKGRMRLTRDTSNHRSSRARQAPVFFMQMMRSIAAVAALAVSASAQALNVSFRAPLSGQTVSGTLQGSSCEVKGPQITSVVFSVDGTQLNTDNVGPWNCT